ncbi:hypothetical protein HBI24_080280 [Parastagonospora nodorum]|nr:hypothetical protein HBH53_180210 [Parastagonospora nodorum]KAH4301663.1 hypothetical protein HBI01_094660 [Parastagonospora nodorum]KAH4306307.1 hypothetical protein HBI02_115050 [Parastagonospora nodorum]KAH4330989.1 hypothetical protein HBI00_083910 [Parastagonospora nodorum]KAH4368799.1 hypothetical protein HBH94_127990 [Parastagonospora nodorum]
MSIPLAETSSLPIGVPSTRDTSPVDSGPFESSDSERDIVNGTEPIAICGLGLRLPGGIRDGDSFWDLLVNGRDARMPIPASRYNISGFNGSLDGRDPIKASHGYFLDEDLSSLDASFFSMTKTELEKADPQQRQLLEVSRECLEDAGETKYRGRNVGCYIGNFGHDWMEMSLREPQHSRSYNVLGYSDMILANRVSYEYDLRGPSVVIKTACSASLVALHEACRALQARDITGAIVGGTSLILAPTLTSNFFGEGILSPGASCKTFDASADGFARAEGITAIYVKRLDDAIRDGNPIRAVIRNTGTNSDGKSMGIMSPNAEAHEALMRHVYEQAGLSPDETAFVECHGTGTATGDPIETTAVGNVFGERGVFIGSVKPNVGHSEGCSGITSLIKSVLALEHKTIPPNIKFKNPNPKIPFAEKKLAVPIQPTPFPLDKAERISVNSFGIGGSNAHVIIESVAQHLSRGYVAQRASRAGQSLAAKSPQLLLYSANTQKSLKEQVDLYRSYARNHPDSIPDLAYTLAIHRERLSQRAFAIWNNGELETSALSKAPTGPPTITMIFSGQGAQWAGMGKNLIETEASFRQDLVSMDEILQKFNKPPSWSILDELQKPAETSQIDRAEMAQPLCTALQVALFHMLMRLGVKPAAVVGHSSGEIAAAYAAGYITLEYALAAAYYRGYVTKDGDRSIGAMAAIGLPAADVQSFLRAGVCVACENSPSSTTISGDKEALKEVIAGLKEAKPDVFARLLKVEMAYHSHHMKPLGKEYLELLQAENNFGTPRSEDKATFISSVTCKRVDDPTSFGPQYWVDNLTSPVLFDSAVTNLKTSGSNVFLEVGPHSTLAGPLRDICSKLSKPFNYIASQIRNQDSTTSFLSAVGKMYQEALPIDVKALFSEDRQALSGLPVYPWDHSGSYWYESRLSSAWRQRPFPHHALLGERTVDSPDFSPIWRNMLSLEDVPWIIDHKIGHDVVFPLAGYISMAGEAIRQTTRVETGYHLRNVEARKALVLTDSNATELLTVLHAHPGGAAESESWYNFSIASCNGDSWLIHCTGQVSPLSESQTQVLPQIATLSKLPRKLTSMRFYEAMARVGVVFGPEFQRLVDITSSATDSLAEAHVVSPAPLENKTPFALHPTAIDACIQLLIVAAARGLCRNLDQLEVPVVVGNVKVFSGAANLRAWAHDFTQGVECLTEDGKVALQMSEVQLAPLGAEAADVVDVHAGARLQWLPDFDFVDPRGLFDKPQRPLLEIELEEQLILLCVLESKDKVANVPPCHPHLAKYREWLALQARRAAAGEYTLVEQAREWVGLPRAERHKLIEETYAKVMALPGLHAYSVGIKRICEHADKIFTGEADTLELLMQDDILSALYDSVSFGYGDFVRLLSNNRPNLRILEVGAGTGGTTEQTLRGLIEESSLPPYSVYTFTDLSAGFFPQGKERFAYAPNMEFKTFDISQDGIAQGFEASSYDIILAPNVVHATASLKETLSNLEALLKPDGFLILSELCSLIQSPNYIFGNFVGWWLGEADGRDWEPYVQPQRWDIDLKAAGFTGVDAFVPDQEVPSYRLAATIISQPARKNQVPEIARAITLLYQNANADIVTRLQLYLQDCGLQVEKCRLGEKMPLKGQDIIATVGLESDFFGEDLTADRLAAFQALIRHVDAEKVLWLCPPFQVRCKDPRSAQTLGVARTVRTELSLPLFTMEIDTNESRFDELVYGVLQKIRTTKDEASLHADKEFVVIDGQVCIGRYHPFELKKELPSSTLTLDSAAAYLIVGGAGGLGRSMATWLVEHGATDLIILSRHAGKDEESQSLSHELGQMGCTAHLVAGSVENADDIAQAIDSTKKVIKGVFQLAMVLKDAPLLEMTYSDWVDVNGPKVKGTWNLHNVLKDQPLDFFWLASSILTAADTPGQANYLATGTFLEAFCQFRHSLELPASVLNISPVEGVGFVAENPQAKKNLKAQGIYTLREREFLDFLELNLIESVPSADGKTGPTAIPPKPWLNRSQVLMGLRSEQDLADPQNRATWRHNRRMGLYRNQRARESESTGDSKSGSKTSALQAFLERVRELGDESLLRGEGVDFLAVELGKKIYDLMLKPHDEEEMDTGRTLAQIGLDSLMAIELRRWIKQVFGLTMSVLEIMGSGSLKNFAGDIGSKYAEKIRG